MSRRPKILLVDDEPNIIMGLARVLFKDNDKYDVLLASSGKIAQDIIRELPISVMVTDINMPEMNGIDLICWTATEYPETRVVAMTGFEVAQIRDHAYRLGCLQVVQKPFDLNVMRQLISELTTDQLSGRLAGLSVMDIIQMLCLGRQSTGIEITHGSKSGIILIVLGEIVHAVWGDIVGEQALFHILATHGAVFRTQNLPLEYPKSIEAPWQRLLMEGMRQIDEKLIPIPDCSVSTASKPLPAISVAAANTSAHKASKMGTMTSNDFTAAVKQSQKTKAAGGVPDFVEDSKSRSAQLIQRGFEHMKSGDPDSASVCWEAALKEDPGNQVIKTNLRRLAAMRENRS